jgi:hypothetical protein
MGAICLVGLMAVPALGLMITPNDDVTVVRNSPDGTDNGERLFLLYNNKVVGGMPNNRVLKTAHLEFALDSEAVAQATLNLFALELPGSPTGTNTFGYVYGRVGQFTETTATWNNMWGGDVNPDWSGWTLLGDVQEFATQQAVQVYGSMDITAFYNANLGQTVHIAMQNSTPINGVNPVSFASKENTTPNSTPYIDAVVPEPVSLMLLALGSVFLCRRRG